MTQKCMFFEKYMELSRLQNKHNFEKRTTADILLNEGQQLIQINSFSDIFSGTPES